MANLESLADALPDLLADGETEEGLRQLREGKIRHKSIKMRKGALKRKERIVRGEMDRFSHSLAQLNAMGVAGADAGGDMQVETQGEAGDGKKQTQAQTQAQTQTQTQGTTASTAGRWAALRGFIASTMEQNPAFVGKTGEK